MSVYASSECLTEGTTSKPNVVTLCQGCSDISEDAHGLIRAIFLAPVSEVCVTFIPADPEDSGVLRAYDMSHVLLDESISTPGVTEPLCVTATGIHSVEFSGYTFLFGWFDDMSIVFEGVPAVPATFGGIKALYR